MMASNITKLKIYSGAIDVDDFADYLIQRGFLNQDSYNSIWNLKDNTHKKNSIFDKLDRKGPAVVEEVLQYLKNTYPNVEIIRKDEKNFRKSTIRGGLPKLPPNYVKRHSLSRDVKHMIESLDHNKLLIHGMMGYGKSCLVNEILNDITLRKHFDNNVFWINLGEHHTLDNVMQPLWRLYTMASYDNDKRLTRCPENVDELRRCLIELFVDSDYLENALIILDDVCDPEVLQCFDLNCNTVITTQDREILRKKEEAAFIEVKTGFSLEETLELFRKSLKVGVSKKLPPVAEEIHYICKGHPLLIAMIGSYLCDYKNANYCDTLLWKYIKQMSLSGDYRLNRCDEATKIPTEILDKCISKLLTTEQREYYEDLAIFVQDVNIPPEVLEILWDKSKFEVKNLMNKFAEKSLIVPFYHDNTFIYGVHDLHLNYLKEQTKHRITSMHEKLILNYDKLTDGDFSKLPDDNYSFQFIGYHLKHAEAFDRFAIYFDLRFLGAKVKACGKEDVIKDMERYKEYITKNDNYLIERLHSYKDFIKHHGANLYYYRHTDIIQYALQENKDSYVFKEAFEIAKDHKRLYFQPQKTINNLDYPETIHVREDISCARFVDSYCHILMGSSKGSIKYFYEQYDKPLSNFEGHTGAVTDLQISSDKNHFLSVSDDHTVILWRFAPDSSRSSFDLGNCLASPKLKQRDCVDLFAPDRAVSKPKRTFKLNDEDDYLVSASFSNAFEIVPRIVTGSNKGNVIIWDVEGTILQQTSRRGYAAPFVTYLPGYLMFSCDDSIIRFSVNESQENWLKHLTPLKVRCNCPFFISEHQIVAVSGGGVVLFDNWEKDGRIEPVTAFENGKEDGENVCATVTQDLKYLVIGTDKNVVLIYDIEEGKVVRRYNNCSHNLSKFVDTVYDEHHSVHLLLIGSDRKTLQMYYIRPVENDPCIQNSPKFIPFWKKRSSAGKPLFALGSCENKLQIFQGYTLISESEVSPSRITCTCFSTCGTRVVYGLENGEVHQYNIKSKSDTVMKNLCCDGAISYLQCFGVNTPLMSPSSEFKGFLLNGHSRNNSISSSNDSLLDSVTNETNSETIVTISENFVKIQHHKEVVVKEIKNPLVFHVEGGFVIVDETSNVYYLNPGTANLTCLRISNFEQEVRMAATCIRKKLLCLGAYQKGRNILEILQWDAKMNKMYREKHEELPFAPVSCCFAPDGELLAVGMNNGLINIYKVMENYRSETLQLHLDPIRFLMFSPSVDPILVSMAEQIAWWDLKPLKPVPKIRNKPNSINILGIDENSCQMNMNFWSEKEPCCSVPHLLSCVKLPGRPKAISASNDFSLFLIVDDKGKINVLEAISSVS